MYLAAQRVVGPSAAGVGVYWYSHEPQLTVLSGELHDLFKNWAETNPGRVVVAAPVATSGHVLSYLDVLAPDSLSLVSVLQQLDLAIASVPPPSPVESVWRSGSLALRFGAAPALGDRFTELRRLKDELRVRLGSGVAAQAPMTPVAGMPVVIRLMCERDPLGHSYYLAPDSRAVLEAALGRALPGSLHVGDVTLDAFERYVREVGLERRAEYVQALTTLTVEQLTAFADVVIFDVDTGNEIWRARRRT